MGLITLYARKEPTTDAIALSAGVHGRQDAVLYRDREAGRALAVALLKLSPPWAASCDVQLLAVAIGMAQLSPKASTLASQTTKQGDGAGDPFALLLLFTWRITWQLPTNQLARWCARCVPPRPIRTFGFTSLATFH